MLLDSGTGSAGDAHSSCLESACSDGGSGCGDAGRGCRPSPDCGSCAEAGSDDPDGAGTDTGYPDVDDVDQGDVGSSDADPGTDDAARDGDGPGDGSVDAAPADTGSGDAGEDDAGQPIMTCQAREIASEGPCLSVNHLESDGVDLFWSAQNGYAACSAEDGRIVPSGAALRKARINGGALMTLHAASGPEALLASWTLASNRVVFSPWSSQEIRWLPSAGGPVNVLSNTANHAWAWDGKGIAATATDLFWLDRTGSFGSTGFLARAPLTGGLSTRVATGLGSAPGAVELAGGFAFFATCPNGGGSSTLYRMSVLGGAAQPLASTPSCIFGIAIAGGQVYYAMDTGEIYSVPTSGGGTPISFERGTNAYHLQTDGSDLFWLDLLGTSPTNQYAIKKKALGGGAIHTVASGMDETVRFALDDRCVYWAKVTSRPPSGGPPLRTSIEAGPK